MGGRSSEKKRLFESSGGKKKKMGWCAAGVSCTISIMLPSDQDTLSNLLF
ncbi:hypothetical protein CHISP_1662 [Chitinispirillum alkaliphilum]|nr:hypothetical protein CHISP_1662 [Chitinispirillum alkaliphilum]